MTDALMRLERETATVGALLGDAAGRLAADRDAIGASLRNAIADVETLAGEIADADERPAGYDDILDGLLRSAYTMASERQIHEAFLGEAESPAMRQGVDAGRRPYAGDEPIAAVA